MKTFALAVSLLPTLIVLAHAMWPISDGTPEVFGSRRHAAVLYHDRIDFFNLPENMELRKKPGASATLGIYSGTHEVPLNDLKPAKVMQFKHGFETQPLFLLEPRVAPFLVCTKPDQDVTPNDDLGGPRSIPDAKGNFCGVLSAKGDVIFEFPVKQNVPDTIARPLGITEDGHRAAIVIGESVISGDEDGHYYDLGKPREVMIWEYPEKLSRVPTSKFHTPVWEDLIKQFWNGQI